MILQTDLFFCIFLVFTFFMVKKTALSERSYLLIISATIFVRFYYIGLVSLQQQQISQQRMGEEP